MVYCRSEALNKTVPAQGLLKESSLPPPQFGIRSKNRKGTQPHLSTENWIKDLLNMALPSEQDPDSPTVSLSHQETFIRLLSLSLRGQTEWKPQ